MRLALVMVGLLAGCIHPLYTCETDADCNVGSAGRCEANHECTVYDQTCPLERRYTEYSGPESNVCFDDSVTPLNECAGGQPPSPNPPTDACAKTVCQELPSCCRSQWSDACVQEAQLHCGLKCDFDIAIVAAEGPNLLTGSQAYELWDVRFNGSNKSQAVLVTSMVDFVEWLAPTPGETSPRLAGIDGTSGNLVVGEGSTAKTFPLDPAVTYDGVASIDFDRDGKDTAVLSGNNSPDQFDAGVLKLGSGAYRPLANTPAMPLQTWGETNVDGFPDAAAANADSSSYRFMNNIDDGTGLRGVDDLTVTGTPGGDTPQVRSFDWTDINRDGDLDVVAFGGAIQITLGQPAPLTLGNVPNVKIDCDPPTTTLTKCNGSGSAAALGFAGAVELQAAETDLLVSVIDTLGSGEPNRSNNLYRLSFPMGAFNNNPVSFTLSAPPGDACTGLCSIDAVVARDFDGDGIIDVVAIDSTLAVWMGLSGPTHAPPQELVWMFRLPTALTTPIPIVRTSVSGTVSP